MSRVKLTQRIVIRSIDRLFCEAKTALGWLDILVNNAGVYEFLPLGEVSEERFHKQFDLNVLAVLLASKEAVKHFDAASGSIVSISSAVSTLTHASEHLGQAGAPS